MNVSLKLATLDNVKVILDIDDLKRDWTKAISQKECYLIFDNVEVVGFLVFNYTFFDCGWLGMIEIRKDLQEKGIGEKAINLVVKMCRAQKLFTSTNKSNIPMRRLLTKMNFIFSGELDGLDKGDPELFYYYKNLQK
ncbi:MAG: GNAT family N-acetyltransferase [Firmicutes bacterium]|nr:GNAT family N-acetyltransferase [Bacillota bacterium]